MSGMSDTWECISCGLINGLHRSQCQACFNYTVQRNLAVEINDYVYSEEDEESYDMEQDSIDDSTEIQENTNIILLVSGYIHKLQIQAIPDDIKEIIRLFWWNISETSMKCIAATHLIASIINKFFNHRNNQCEFVKDKNDYLNILKYIYIRGGALRDCYLLRKINDIDMVIDTHNLSQKYLSHLKKYHSNIKHQSKDCKCILWRYYLNKFVQIKSKTNYPPFIDTTKHDEIDEYNPFHHDSKHYHRSPPKHDENVRKILKFEHDIIHSNYLLNAKFITQILSESSEIAGFINVESKFYDYHRTIRFREQWRNNSRVHCIYGGFKLSNVSIDIDDQFSHPYDGLQTCTEYEKLYGVDNVKNALLIINKYRNETHIDDDNDIELNISIPIYPFPMNMIYYDFTINAMHIDLYNVLINDNYPRFGVNKNDIDFNWENKIKNKKYDNHIINKYNLIGINHLNKKILKPPIYNVNLINFYYFWRLIKISSKFIDEMKIDQHDDDTTKWKIDNKYLLETIKNYQIWFDDNIDQQDMERFVDKFVKWSICKYKDDIKRSTKRLEILTNIMNRFKVFRYIKFENHFKKKLNKYPQKFKYILQQNIQILSLIYNGAPFTFFYQTVMEKCFEKYQYPTIKCKH